MNGLNTFAPTAEQIQAARHLLLAIAHRDVVTPIVEAYQADILARHAWPKAARWAQVRADRAGHAEWLAKPVLADNEAFLLSDEHYALYLSECSAAQVAAGLITRHADECPKLVARELVRKAQLALVALMEPVAGVDWDAIAMDLNTMDQYIDLCLLLLAPHVGTADDILATV